MVSIFYPVADTEKSKVSLWSGGSSNQLHQIVDTLCCRPQYKLLQMRQIPQCPSSDIKFNSDLWEGMAGRVRQMIATNSSESKVNWNTKVGNPSHRGRMIKSLANMVFLRGDGVFDKST
jgi:hypothetical protein